ncbi:MAG: hypothetical protein AAF311_15170, partial [Pseudomonadota bacterium]
MRNVFDQYTQPENRLTHAIAVALSESTTLRAAFMTDFLATPAAVAARDTIVSSQTMPGSDTLDDEAEAERMGVPDLWLAHEETGWCAVFENKLTAPFEPDQVRRHVRTAARRGFSEIEPVVLACRAEPRASEVGARSYSWREIHAWLRRQTDAWAHRAAGYFETLEARMIARDEELPSPLTG